MNVVSSLSVAKVGSKRCEHEANLRGVFEKDQIHLLLNFFSVLIASFKSPMTYRQKPLLSYYLDERLSSILEDVQYRQNCGWIPSVHLS